MSLASRLLAGMAVVIVVLVATATVVTRTTRDHLIDQVDEQLERSVGAGSPWRGGPPGTGPRTPETRSPGQEPLDQLNDYFVASVDEDGQVTVIATPGRSDSAESLPEVTADEAREAAEDGRPFDARSVDGGENFRMVADGPLRSGAIVVIGRSTAEVDDAVGRLVMVELLATIAVIAVLSLVTWWVLRLGVRPIRAMTSAASTIAAGDLSHRVPEADPGTEAGQLGEALNSMLGRIETVFDERTESEARLRRFVADASHELRTPVTTIRGYSELYRHGGLAPGVEMDEAMRRTEEEATRMGNLVGDLLLLARLDQGRPLARDRVELDALASDAVRDARVVHPERALQLDVAPVQLLGDEERLRQVLANLLSNAVEHTPATTTVTVRVAADGDRAVLEVTDDGPGMAADDVTKAFERFHRADPSRSRARGGSGLGLSIVSSIVEAHGGTVSLASEPGRGTTATVRLPVDTETTAP